MSEPDWLRVRRGSAPLILSLPHAGTWLPAYLEPRLASSWLARKDTDWWIDELYGFAEELDATMVASGVSRTVIDVNRDPSGASLYPGMATTDLCPTTTFDGEPLYRTGQGLLDQEIRDRAGRWLEPYHAALEAETKRLRRQHAAIVVYDCHSIRSAVPRLFEGDLPIFNIGTNGGASCAAGLGADIEAICADSGASHVRDGRFKGGYITRHFGRPEQGIHAIQMEIACRGYMREPNSELTPANWPAPYDASVAGPLRETLRVVLRACLAFAGRASDAS